MKKSVIISLVILVIAAGLAFAAGGRDGASGASNELTVYYSHATDWTDPIFKQFQDQTGINVNLVGAGTGELVARIGAEKQNPLADILWGGGSDIYDVITDLLEPYRPQEIASLDPATYHPNYFYIGTSIDPMLIIYNPVLVPPDQAPKGWADLLNPRFKGKIAHADPARSGSSFVALIIQLLSQGGDNERGWAYMRSFVDNLDVKLLGSSSLTFRGVATREYEVGITYEEAGLRYQAEGAELRVVYPADGNSKMSSPIAIVKGARNLENAKKFVDFVLTKEIQDYLGTVYRRSVRTDIPLPATMVPNNQIGDIPYDNEWISANRDRIMDTWRNMIVQ